MSALRARSTAPGPRQPAARKGSRANRDGHGARAEAELIVRTVQAHPVGRTYTVRLESRCDTGAASVELRRQMRGPDVNEKRVKGAVSITALAVIVVRESLPSLLDSIDLMLIAFAILPWLASLIHRLELPGGFKIELRHVQDAGVKITGQETAPHEPEAAELPFLGIAEVDPNLALVGLRIELERRLRRLAEHSSIDHRQPLLRLLRRLQKEGTLALPVASGIQELVTFGNRAAHGATVDPETVSWATDVGPRVLKVLDDRLAEME